MAWNILKAETKENDKNNKVHFNVLITSPTENFVKILIVHILQLHKLANSY